MFSNCEDDLCIFVCGTCKRYFTQLSAFSQHKKEKLCKKNNALQQNWFAANMMIPNLLPHANTEEVDSDTPTDNHDHGDCSNEHLMNNEGAEFTSQKRKYPRKQDKTKIKRTVRDFDPEEHALLARERGKPAEHSPEGAAGQDQTQNAHPQFSFPGHTRLGASMFGKPSQNVATCRHPVYVCKICHMEFPRLTGKPFKCSHCRRGFLTERDLKVHVMRAKHDNLCDVCGKIFPDKYKLRKHTLSHMTEKNFPCDVPGCGKAFKSAEDVRTHVKYVHASEKRYRCELCGRAFTRPDKYKQHMETHNRKLLSSPSLGGPQPLASNAYGSATYKTHPSVSDEAVFYDNNNVQNVGGDVSLSPMTTHDPPSMASSIFPTETTNTVSNVDDVSMTAAGNHLTEAGNDGNLLNQNEKPRSTSQGSFYQTASSSRPSSESYTEPLSPDGQGTITEEDTGVPTTENTKNANNIIVSKVEPVSPRYNTNDDVQAMEEHSKDNVAALEGPGQECTRCLARFSTQQEFLAHDERSPDQVHRCPHCSLQFLSICELRCHGRESHDVMIELEENHGQGEEVVPMSGHPPEQAWSHSCKECGKAFTRPDKLRRHSIIHSPDRPCIPCMCRDSHGCMLTFHRKDSMKRHALAHTRGKPYKCYLCDKTFSRQDYVNKHLNQVHNRIFKHNCPFCDYGTLDPRRLKQHVRSKHKADANSVLPPELSGLDDDDSETEPLPGTDVSPNVVPTREKSSPNEERAQNTYVSLNQVTPGDKSPPATEATSSAQYVSPTLMPPGDGSPSDESLPNTYISPRFVSPEGRLQPKTEPGTYVSPDMSTPCEKPTSQTESLPGAYISPSFVSPEEKFLPEVETLPGYPGRRVTLDDGQNSDPLPFSDTPEMVSSRVTMSAQVRQQSGRHRSFLNTMPPSTMQHYSTMSANSVLNSPNYPHFPAGQNLHMVPNAEHSLYSANQVYRSRHKSPLNSLTVPPTSQSRQQSEALYGVSDVMRGSHHNAFS